MSDLTASSARTRIDVAEASEIARLARAGDPTIVAREEVEALLGRSALVLDGLRRRPRYFDGRFLTGADLTRDQEYVRRRQADLARATGTGVVAGLEVSLEGFAGSEMLVIEAGHGVTPSGDLVLVTTRRSFAPLDLPAVERLDATLGLRAVPRTPLGRRTGLFLLALRAVEFTANPIAAYPTRIDGPRRVEDGDVIEATAVTLIPWPDTGGAATLNEARRALARRLFLGEPAGMPQEALPLAMIAMERGAIRWIDMPLVRRETGADTPLQVSLGGRPRALAEAFVLQHQSHLADVLAERARAGQAAGFAAAEHFAALPAAGLLTAASILTDPLGFRQIWFPPTMEVDVSFVPEDEIPSLVEESLAMPPIDLLGDAEDLDATGVVVMAPVSRARLARFRAQLAQPSFATRPDPGQGLRRAPLAALEAMLARRSRARETALRDAEAEARAAASEAEIRAWTTAWAEAVAALPAAEGGSPLLWYVRRRAVADRASITGVAIAVTGDDAGQQRATDERLAALGLTERAERIATAATPFAEARIAALLAAPRITAHDMLVASVVRDLERALPAEDGDAPVERVTPERGTGGRITLPGASDRLALRDALRAPVFSLPASRAEELRNVLAAIRAEKPVKDEITEAEVLAVAAAYAGPRLGEGLDRLAAAPTKIPATGQVWIGDEGRAVELDGVLRAIDATDLPRFAERLAKAADAKDAAALEKLIGEEG
jgi:hypothetical protein